MSSSIVPGPQEVIIHSMLSEDEDKDEDAA